MGVTFDAAFAWNTSYEDEDSDAYNELRTFMDGWFVDTFSDTLSSLGLEFEVGLEVFEKSMAAERSLAAEIEITLRVFGTISELWPHAHRHHNDMLVQVISI